MSTIGKPSFFTPLSVEASGEEEFAEEDGEAELLFSPEELHAASMLANMVTLRITDDALEILFMQYTLPFIS
ncbi:hypothetical protein PghCCS26_49230 [Paenibacillus glycanilyticus]|uniref:Uncharacterized protein n=1 Tax=Paenibacillus glycanilyticus TaxID=126569 RepID=A0ABQ6NSH1_9BACL|nr:hypothetical protein PghCCS26_49230 [Paenibacillus glycanilyticus]